MREFRQVTVPVVAGLAIGQVLSVVVGWMPVGWRGPGVGNVIV